MDAIGSGPGTADARTSAVPPPRRGRRTLLMVLGLSVALLAAYLFVATALFRSAGLWLNVVYPSLLIVLLFTSATLVRYFFAFSIFLRTAFATPLLGEPAMLKSSSCCPDLTQLSQLGRKIE